MADATARLRLIVQIMSEGNLNALVSEAQGVAREVQAALNGASTSGAGGGGTSTDFFSGLRTTVQLTRGELEQFYGTTAATFNKVMGEDIPLATQMSTRDLQSFYSTVTGMNTELPSTNSHLDNLNRMFALQNIQVALDKVREFGQTLLGVLGDGVEQAMTFETTLVDISNALRINKDNAVLDGSLSGAMDDLSAKALKVALATKFNDAEILQLIAYLTQNGISSKTVLDGAAESVAYLAQATNSDWKPAAESITAVLHAQSKTLREAFTDPVTGIYDENKALMTVADTMTNINQTTGESLGTMASTFKYVLTISDEMGIKFQDAAVAIDLFARSGIRGSQAGTALRRLMQNLTPVSDKAAEVMHQLGIITADGTNRFYDASGSMKSLSEIQTILYESTQGLNDEQKIFALRTIFGTYALQSMMKLATTSPKDFADLAEKLGQSGTAMQKSGEWAQTTAGKWDIFNENVTSAKRLLGQSLLDSLKPTIDFFNGLVSSFTALSPETMNVIASIAGVIGVLATLVGTVGSAVTGFMLLNAGLAAAGTSFGAIALTALPIVAVIAAVVAAVALLYEAWTNDWGHIREVTAAVWDYVGPTIISAMTTVRDTVVSAVQAVIEWWDKIAPDVQRVIDFIVAAIAYFAPVWKATWEAIVAVVSGVWTIITGVIKGAWEVISGIFDFFIHLLTGNWSALWDDIKRILTGVWDIIVGLFKGLWDAVSGVFVAFWHGMVGMFAKMWDDVRGPLQTLWDGIVGVWTSIKTWLVDTANSIWKSVASAFKGVWDDTISAFTGIYDSIKEWLGKAWDWIVNMFTELPKQALEWGKNLLKMLVEGISSGIKWVEDKVKEVAATIKRFLGFHSPTEAGPLSDSDEYMPNMMAMFAGGILDGIPDVQTAAAKVAGAISEPLSKVGANISFDATGESAARALLQLDDEYKPKLDALRNRIFSDTTLDNAGRISLFGELKTLQAEFDKKREEVGNSWKGAASAVNDANASIVSSTTGTWTGASTATTAGANSVSTTISVFATQAKAQMSAVANEVAMVWQSLWATLTQTASQALTSLAVMILAGLAKIVAAIRSAASEVSSVVDSLAGSMFASGANAITMLAEGMNSRLSLLRAAASAAASVVQSFLGFHSPTEEGPASDADRWAPNFVNMLADTMTSARPALQRALSGLAMDFSVGVNGGMSTAASTFVGSGGGRGSTYQIVINYSGRGTREDDDYLVNQLRRVIAMK